MPDAEYSKEFGVYYTTDGLFCSVNPTVMKILNVMQLGEYTIRDLSSDLQIPEPTLRTMFKRLEQKKLISSEKKPGDNRTIYYKCSCSALYSSLDPKISQEFRYASAIHRLDTTTLVEPVYRLAYATAYMEKFGIDVSPFLERIATLIADYIYDDSFENIDDLLSRIERILNRNSTAKLHISYLDGTVEIVSNTSDYEKCPCTFTFGPPLH